MSRWPGADPVPQGRTKRQRVPLAVTVEIRTAGPYCGNDCPWGVLMVATRWGRDVEMPWCGLPTSDDKPVPLSYDERLDPSPTRRSGRCVQLTSAESRDLRDAVGTIVDSLTGAREHDDDGGARYHAGNNGGAT